MKTSPKGEMSRVKKSAPGSPDQPFREGQVLFDRFRDRDGLQISQKDQATGPEPYHGPDDVPARVQGIGTYRCKDVGYRL